MNRSCPSAVITSVTAEIARYDREIVGQRGSDLVPHDQRLGAAVQKEQAVAGSGRDEVDSRRLRRLDAVTRESLEHRS